MKKIRLFFLLSVAALSFTGCNPDDDNSNPNNNNNDNFSENFGNAISRDFIGQVVDINNNPIQNAAVKIGSSTAQTDANGVFIINDANVHQRFAYITAKKAGFIDGSRALVPNNGKNNVKIMMIPSTPIETIASGVVSEVALPSGTKVTFDGAFKDENGNAYSGNVSVSMYHLQATNPDVQALMPGMLYAEAQNGDERMLETFGMLNVELRGSGGQKLQIANGHTADIEMMVDNAQAGTAPATIPLWHFDEAKGYWKEDGVATKVGNKYVGEVSHFSWWNCDAPFPAVNLHAHLVNASGNPLANVMVELSYNGPLSATVGYTNSNGEVSGLVPANQTLTMTVYDICHSVVSSITIGPFAVDTTLPDTVINNGSVLSTQILGTLLKCDSSNVTNGYVMLQSNNQTSFTEVTNGDFEFTTIVCSSTTSTFSLTGVDYDNLQTTDSIQYTYTTPITNVGNLMACTNINEFISYQIDSEPVVYVVSNLTGSTAAQGTTNGLSLSGWGDNGGMFIWGNTNIPGIYTTPQFTLEGGGIYVSSQMPNTVSFNLTTVGAVGEYIDMTFSGTYDDTNGTHTITGVAHVIRDN